MAFLRSSLGIVAFTFLMMSLRRLANVEEFLKRVSQGLGVGERAVIQ